MLSLAHLSFMHADPVRLIGLARMGGFDAVGLRLVDPGPESGFSAEVSDAGLRRRIRDELAATGVRLFDIEAFWLWPQTDVAALRPALEAGAELGARHMMAAGNDPDRARLLANLAQLCTLAGELGLTVGFEFMPYTTINTLALAYEAVQEVAQPNARLLVDILHLSRVGGAVADLATVPQDAYAYGHICDAPALAPATIDLKRHEARAARLYPGDGGLDLTGFIRALPPGAPLAMEAPANAYPGDDEARARRAGAACRAAMARAAQG